jgi:dienelactone hydrolase
MKDFSTFEFASEGFPARTVYQKGAGPAVVLLHELPGMIHECVDLGRRIAAADFTVYMPLLFDQPDRSLSVGRTLGLVAQICISHEFYCFAKQQSSPITQWLKALCREAHADCGGPGVGVIGMCLTGGFVLLFDQPDRSLSVGRTLGLVAQICISHEFYCFAKQQSSPITQWLKALCREAHADCGGPGVGVIGMCLTGGFVLSLMADESVIAPVASQPSLPIGITREHRAALGVSEDDLEVAKARAEAGVPLLAIRFSEDRTSPKERFDTLRQVFGGTSEVIRDDEVMCWKQGKALETIEINSGPGNPFDLSPRAHPVLTLELREAGHPTHDVLERVLQFLKEHLA